MNDREILEESQNMNNLLLDVCNSQKIMLKQMKVILVTVIICFTLIICTMVGGFFWYESQFDYVTTETTTTTLTTEGENANINNVSDGNMYNDNAIHNEGVDE